MKIFSRIKMCVSVTGRLMGMSFQIVRGLWVITKLPRPCVSIFGGAQREGAQEKRYYALAEQAAALLVEHKFSVLTGGGPGIMEAANCGAHATQHHAERTLKVIMRGLPLNELPNKCVGEAIYVDDFLARKWLLIDYSVAFIIFPGGLGTLDELSDLMNLMHTGKIKRRTVILIGVDYWKPYKDFFVQAKAQQFVLKDVPDPVLMDNVEAAVALIISTWQK